MLTHDDQKEYLNRIGITYLSPDKAILLKKLHLAHLCTVPFENLDIVFGRKINLSPRSIFRKIINERRGGFCYELNFSFYMLLKSLDYNVDLLSGSVFKEENYGPDFDHLLLLVDLDGQKVIADVGFGESFLTPVRLDGTVLAEPDTAYKIEDGKNYYKILERKSGHGWAPQYIFQLKKQELPNFQAMADFHQTSPDSAFTRKSICSIATDNGRTTLSARRFIVTNNGKKTETDIDTHSQYTDCLKTYFGVRLPQSFDVKRWFDRQDLDLR